MSQDPAGGETGFDTGSRADFYRYYEAESDGASTRARFAAIQRTLLRMLGERAGPLAVGDVGCGAGTQARLWAERGHRVSAVDINAALIALARRRARERALEIGFEVASATALPWADQSMDLCIMPELLEHVADWRACIAECVRVLKPGGALFIITSNKLCPRQEEFTLPLYSWYPGRLKRHCERLAVTTHPALANHATYPAVNWFTYYDLRDHLRGCGLASLDRFDLADPQSRGALARVALGLVKRLPPLRFLAHAATPYTMLMAFKPAA